MAGWSEHEQALALAGIGTLADALLGEGTLRRNSLVMGAVLAWTGFWGMAGHGAGGFCVPGGGGRRGAGAGLYRSGSTRAQFAPQLSWRARIRWLMEELRLFPRYLVDSDLDGRPASE
jgi:hypothetical protein